MPDIGSNIPQFRGPVQQGELVRAKPKQEANRTTSGITILGGHRISEKPSPETKSTVERMKSIYEQKVKSFSPEKLQTEIAKSEREIKSLQLRGDFLGKHFMELEKFKLTALKTEQACRVPGIIIAGVPVIDVVDLSPADPLHAKSQPPANHPWAQSVHRGLQDPNITYVQMSQNKSEYNVALFRRDGGVQNIVVKNARDYNELIAQVKSAKQQDDIKRNLSQLRGVKPQIKTMSQAKKALEKAKPGTYLVVPNPKKSNEFAIVFKTNKGVKSYRMRVTDKGFEVQGRNEKLSSTSFDALVQTLHSRTRIRPKK